MGLKFFLLCALVFILVSTGALLYANGYNSGYEAHRGEIERIAIQSALQVREASEKLSKQVLEEREKLEKIKNEKPNCKHILDFNLRRCIG